MSRRSVAVSGAFAVLFLGAVSIGSAQFELPKRIPRIPVEKIPGLDRIPGLDKMLGREAPITTSLADAVTEVPFLDSYNPEDAVPMGAAARHEDGNFLLNPGAYTFEAQSYCLKAGTHGPGGGAGYLYAPLAGPKAPIVRSILQRSIDHPEIAQRDIQVLLWAIIARTNLSKMSRENQLTAARLLTPKELFDLNGGALGLVPEEMKQKAFGNLPPAVRQIVEAENKLRQMLTETNATFAELERVAVLAGAPPAMAGDRAVPDQRWSYHSDGYFIRFDPDGYSATHLEIYVPEPFAIDRDENGRIVRVIDSSGDAIEITWQGASTTIDSGLAANSFRSITFRSRGDEGATIQNRGWALAGLPSDRKSSVTAPASFTDFQRRYDVAKHRKQQFSDLIRQTRGSKGKKGAAASESTLRDLLDLASLHDAVQSLSAAKSGDARLNLILEAWQSTFVRQVGNKPPQIASLDDQGTIGGPDSGKTKLDPAGNVGTPGETGRQRLGQSGRCQKECECPDNKDVCAALKAAAKISQSALGTATGMNVPVGGATTPAEFRNFKNQMGAALDKMAKDFCTMPQIPDMKKTLDSLDPSKAPALSEKMKIASIDRELDDLIAQLCGPPPEPPKPTPKKSKCADGSDPDPGGEKAMEQLKESLKQALTDAEKELGSGKLAKIDNLKKALGMLNQVKAAGCMPQDVISLVAAVLGGRDDLCLDMCHETAKWVSEVSGNPSMESTFFKACGVQCD